MRIEFRRHRRRSTTMTLNISMPSLPVFFYYMSVACFCAACVLGQNQPAEESSQNYSIDGNRLKVSVNETKSRIQQEQPYLIDGSIKLLCRDTSDSNQLTNLQWALLDPFTNETATVPAYKSTPSNNGRDLTYSALNIDENEGGYYVCVGYDGGQQIRSEPLVMDIISPRALATSQSPSTTHRRNSLSTSDATLVCNVIMKNPLPVRWMGFKPLDGNFQRVPINAPPANATANAGSKYHTEDNGQKLIIHNVTTTDMGRYTCQLDTQSVQSMPSNKIPEKSITFTLAPFVKPFDTSRGDIRSHIVGDPFVILCNASVPTKNGTVMWYHDGKLIDSNSTLLDRGTANFSTAATKHVTISTAPDASNPEWLISELRIGELSSEDAGKYMCRVHSSPLRSENDSHSQQFTLALKDKYAALYPFLAILAEVILLVIIIFIYERRHNRKAAQDYRAEAGGDDDEETQPVNSSRHH